MPLAICESLAVLCSIYISFVEHPVTAPSYKRAIVMQASLAALGTLAAVAAWLMGASVLWLVGALLLGVVIPFTLVVILPTNKRLLDPWTKIPNSPNNSFNAGPCCTLCATA